MWDTTIKIQLVSCVMYTVDDGWNEHKKVIAEAKSKWEHYIPCIIKQAQLEKGIQIEKSPEIAITDEDSKVKCSWYFLHTLL